MEKLTTFIRNHESDKFIRDWKPFVDFIHVKYNNKWLAEDFEDKFYFSGYLLIAFLI